jgi:hypothetical protein
MDQRGFCWLKIFVINIKDVLPIKVRNQQEHVPPLQDKMEEKKWNSSTINNESDQITRRLSSSLANCSQQVAAPYASIIALKQQQEIIMADKKNVLLIGWDPEVVDYSKWPDLTSEKLSAALEADRLSLISQGYEASWCFVVDAGSAVDVVTNALKNATYECVLIGAGVRLSPDAFIVFELLVNTIHSEAPTAKICFNTNPSDTADAVKRWV